MPRCQPRVVGRSLVGKANRCRQRSMVAEVFWVSEDLPQHRCRCRCLKRPVPLADEIGRRQVQPAVGGVGIRRDGGGIGRPHRGCAGGSREEVWSFTGGCGQHRRIVTCKADPPQRRHQRPLLRWQHPLGNAKADQQPHLGDSLEGRRSGVGHLVPMPLGGEIADPEPTIVVRRPDESVEVQFNWVNASWRKTCHHIHYEFPYRRRSEASFPRPHGSG